MQPRLDLRYPAMARPQLDAEDCPWWRVECRTVRNAMLRSGWFGSFRLQMACGVEETAITAFKKLSLPPHLLQVLL
jgi:hypothetical protein